MSSTQNPFEDPIHGAPATGIRGMLRGLSVRQQEKSQEKKAARLRTQNWILPDSGECKSWSLEEINYLVNASISNKKAISNAGNVANQCREWVNDCKKTLQSLEEALRLIINKKEAQAAIAQACKHPVPDNVHLAMKEISDADKRIAALQAQIRGYADALRQWLDKEPGF
ncbi:hypothetical protein FOC1_g10010172 [Fusarium oxysporum f. sp. cubense race 1]|uniref:Uncharacterized protein n=1 Tax=Fusarium oxysporum f. sp. cubense (strain race 1) TaxID=1229664 RepID=N4U1C4_FUSC1|nr:hypothetical protein FOC1_g10010172 [Fusarium oxysporum f. sp. cubense race 1]